MNIFFTKKEPTKATSEQLVGLTYSITLITRRPDIEAAKIMIQLSGWLDIRMPQYPDEKMSRYIHDLITGSLGILIKNVRISGCLDNMQ